jgi:hypothetical protein
MNEVGVNVCVKENVKYVGPVPASVPGDFSVRLGDVMAGQVMVAMEEEFSMFGGAAGAVSGFLSAMHWVEAEVRGTPDLLKGLGRLKGAMITVGVAIEKGDIILCTNPK